MEHRTTLEIIAPSVDEAIDKGLGELGVEESQVEVEVLDQGGGGLFGIGGRQAGEVRTFAYQPPKLSELFMEAVEP